MKHGTEEKLLNCVGLNILLAYWKQMWPSRNNIRKQQPRQNDRCLPRRNGIWSQYLLKETSIYLEYKNISAWVYGRKMNWIPRIVHMCLLCTRCELWISSFRTTIHNNIFTWQRTWISYGPQMKCDIGSIQK